VWLLFFVLGRKLREVEKAGEEIEHLMLLR
jgi:hypothetical protein